MLKIGDKTFLNLQEAVGWLMENNCIPFQCTAPYAANTEIGMGTIVNPSPAKVRIGSIIFFSDSKVSTVTGITQNGFIVSDKYNDLVDDVVYVSNVAINASGHLIVTLSNGTDIDAGLIKQISNFIINASQHLIAIFNDGTTADLGAIFSGDIAISGNLTVTGSINGESNPSMKPVYYHPIYFTLKDGSDNEVGRIQCVILDNQSVAYNATTFVNKIKALMDNWAIINANGYLIIGTSYYDVYMFSRQSSQYLLFYYDPTSRGQVDFDTYTIATLVDGVNKIN